jgi:hypothetical protein
MLCMCVIVKVESTKGKYFFFLVAAWIFFDVCDFLLECNFMALSDVFYPSWSRVESKIKLWILYGYICI